MTTIQVTVFQAAEIDCHRDADSIDVADRSLAEMTSRLQLQSNEGNVE